MYIRSFEQDGFTVTVSHEVDDDGDLSYLTNKSKYDGCTSEEIAKYRKQDNERLEAYENGDWCLLGVCVSIKKQTASNWADGGIEVGRASMWGIESDCDKEYFDEIEADMIAEAFEEVKLLKAALCGDKLDAAVSPLDATPNQPLWPIQRVLCYLETHEYDLEFGVVEMSNRWYTPARKLVLEVYRAEVLSGAMLKNTDDEEAAP